MWMKTFACLHLDVTEMQNMTRVVQVGSHALVGERVEMELL